MAVYFYSQFFQIISFKIRIVMRNTVMKGANFKSLYFPLRNESSNTELYSNLEIVYRREVLKRKNFQFKNVFFLLLERFHHVLYVPFRNKVLDKLILLRPPTSFFWLTYLTNFMFLWSIAILITGSQNNEGVEISAIQAIGWGVLVGFFGSLITFIFTYFAHRYYAKEVKTVFYKEIEEEQERLNHVSQVQIKEINSAFNQADQTEIRESEISHEEHMERPDTSEQDILPLKNGKPKKGLTLKGLTEARSQQVLKQRDPYKNTSVLQMHSKRLNALKYLYSFQTEAATRNVARQEPRRNFFLDNAMSMTATGFFKDDQQVSYKLVTDNETPGDMNLLESELKRSNKSRVNWIHIVMIPFLVLATGL